MRPLPQIRSNLALTRGGPLTPRDGRRSSTPTGTILDDPPVDRRTPPWLIFVLLLLANGNFLRPRPFPILRDGTMPTRRLAAAPWKIAAFLAAFTWLPTGLVLLALAGWAAWITPGLRHLHRAFQNLKEGDLAGETRT